MSSIEQAERTASRSPSAVSRALRALQDDRDRGASSWDSQPWDGAIEGGFNLHVANDRATRERAYRLAQRVYRGCGYACDGESLSVSPFDADGRTLTLLISDRDGLDAATISLVFDSRSGLPCDQIYKDELNVMRRQGRGLVEVTRLAIDAKHKLCKGLLLRMFYLIYNFARCEKRFDDFVIEVNPRHVGYYRRLLCFEQVGPERPCPRVQGAPAVLLRFDLSMPERDPGSQENGEAADARSLVSLFGSRPEERVVGEFLMRSHRPMSAADARYFGLEPCLSRC